MRSIRMLVFFLMQLFFLIQFFNVIAMGYSNNLSKEIFKHWIHSYEDDTKDVMVYRRSDYKFPPARGRRGFEIKENGEFVQYRIGPTDRLEKISGRWKVEEKDKIIVYLEDKEIAPYTINIISCTNDILRIKK